MDNIIYIDDYINLYNNNNHLLIVAKPYKNTLRNGLVIDKEKFIKKFNKILDDNNLKSHFFCENIIIIINNIYTKQDKILLKEIMEELNYKNIQIIQETKYLNVDKNSIHINCNYTYFYFLYTNYLGNIEVKLYSNDDLNKKLINRIVNYLNKKTIILYGKNYKEILNILNKDKIEYYFYEYADNLLIKILLSDK